MTVEIPLTKGFVAIVDDEDAEVITAHKWHAHVPARGRTVYAHMLRWANGRYKNESMHRLILNAPVGFEVDHINQNGLDNRRCNLRLATRAQNEANKPPRSQYKGSYWCQQTGRWRARIRVDGHLRCLGRFDSAEEAARAYDVAAMEAFGEFAYLNFRIEP